MRTIWGLSVVALVALVSSLLPVGCGDGDGSCPGTICSNCSASGDCPNLQCGADQSLFCVAFPFGESTSDQRCTFCEDPDFELP
jgi:hypothetical protein